jgi:peptidoglycan hydrolase-like protein with peptidoglycan-binding domain
VCEKLSDPNNRGACRDTLLLKSLSSAGIPIGWDEAKLKALASFSLPFKLVGWLITAVAVTLGSPFWFDALGKLVKMRSAGAKVEGARAGEASTPKSVTTPTSTPSAPIGEASDDALNDDERRLTEDEIIAIQRGLLMTNDKLTGRLDGNTRAAITSWQGKRGYTVTQELSRAQIDELRHNNSGAAGIQPLASQIAEG